MEHNDENRRRLSDEERKLIVSEILDQVYSDIGKGVLKRIGWLLGTGVAAFLAWLGANHINIK